MHNIVGVGVVQFCKVAKGVAMFVNQNSFLIMAVMILAGTAYWANQGAWQISRVGVLVVVAGVLAVTGWWAHRQASTEAVPDVLAGGKIVLVEYYSDY
jgi:hypothetical protein